ncbi:riboflavin synthase [Pelagibacterales bacterium SAG-MED15]|nr:riboflavin synthase [Pelagibacterales bacterium SAG-MED15]
MFNGIIFNKGIVQNIIKYKKGLNLFIESSLKISKKDLGISISCDGVCLTLVSIKKNIKEFYLSNETIMRSKFRDIKKKDIINLELPMKYGQNISGHICQGHVDTVGIVNKILKSQKSVIFDIIIKNKFKKDLIEKASILINGVSLTISKITRKGFQIWVIPHTLKLTNLNKLKKKDKVNIEIDILSKYVKRYVKKK